MASDPIAGDRDRPTSHTTDVPPEDSGGSLDAYLASVNARFDELAEKIDGSAREIIGKTRAAFRETDDRSGARIIPFNAGQDEPGTAPEEPPRVVRTPFHEPHPGPAQSTGTAVHPDRAPETAITDRYAAPPLRPPESDRYVAPPTRRPEADPHAAPPVDRPEPWEDSPRTRSPETKPRKQRSRRPGSRRRRRRGLIIGAAVIGILMLAAGAFVAGRWFFPDDASATPAAVESSLPSVPSSIAPPTTLVPADPIVGARAAIEAAGVEGVDVRIEGDAAVLTGTVMSEPDREAAARAVLAVPGIVRLDNRVTVAEPAPADPIEVQFAAEAALAAAGLEHLAVSVDDRVAVISGVIPLDALAAGYFAYTEPARAGLLAIEGIDAVSSRLQLRGDEAALRGELEELIDLNPIIFSSGNSEIDEQAAATLNEAARIIISHPGLRVLIAGHTDSAGSTGLNEALAQQRGAAVLGYLVSRGVPITRLQAVSYGELFPDSEAPAALNRRIEFEVAP